ncbi:Archease [Dissulfuribacter thermophilus]|uniref:Archease n=1 Tax=Dissulfuribacter thermophilus TaxID=1156395 RepID=A0A1B9F805_9BACT|nr:archease [Dissulfuribacter thermophilus]OCC16069.1 Archease [Dissulfuribacter thermophilus]
MANSLIKSGFETFEHGADIGIRGYGTCLEEAFSNGAKAMFSIMVDDLTKIEAKQRREISSFSFDLTGLFVAFLNTLIAEADINHMVFSEFNCDIDTNTFSLKGEALGNTIPSGIGNIGVEIKGATFTEAKVEKRGDVFLAQCVVDV